MIKGCDISGHQGPDWEPDADHQFVIIKISEGRTYFSQDSVEQVSTARDHGLLVGYYHFLLPGNAQEQAAWFVRNLPSDAFGPLVCDWENTKEGHPSVADAAEFIAEVKRLRPANKVGLYVNKSDWLNTAVKAGDFLFIASWVTAVGPGISYPWTFWQWTDKPYDQDRASSRFETLDELAGWAKGAYKWSAQYESWYTELGTGRYVTPIDKQILIAAAHGCGWGTVRLSQGGLSTGVAASALTHAGLAAGDVAIDGRSKAAVWNYAAALIRSGIIGFPRGFGADNFPPHIHFASVESYDHAHAQLQAQIDEYRRGGDGLVGDKPYSGPSTKLDRWVNSPYNPVNITADTGKYVVTATTLYGRNVDGAVVQRRVRGYELTAARRVQRWGRNNVVTAGDTYYAAQYLQTAA